MKTTRTLTDKNLKLSHGINVGYTVREEPNSPNTTFLAQKQINTQNVNKITIIINIIKIG